MLRYGLRCRAHTRGVCPLHTYTVARCGDEMMFIRVTDYSPRRNDVLQSELRLFVHTTERLRVTGRAHGPSGGSLVGGAELPRTLLGFRVVLALFLTRHRVLEEFCTLRFDMLVCFSLSFGGVPLTEPSSGTVPLAGAGFLVGSPCRFQLRVCFCSVF